MGFVQEEKEEKALKLWETFVYSRGAVIDPNDERDWEDLAFGFFLGQGFDPETAQELVKEVPLD